MPTSILHDIDYQAQIAARMRHDPTTLRADFEALTHLQANVPAGGRAYRTVPRSPDEWRLPRDGHGSSDSNQMLMLPMRAEWYKPNAYLAVMPQPIIMSRNVSQTLEEYAGRLFRHYPKENTLARREHGVPMLIGRFDVIVDQRGNIQICELDDVCSLWPAMPNINPIAESYLRVLEDQLGLPIYTAELFQYADGPAVASPRVRKEYARISFHDDNGQEHTAYIPRTTSLELAILQQNGLKWRTSQTETDRPAEYYERIMSRFYAHNEDHWHGDIHEAWLLKGEQFLLDDVALSVRAYRDMPGFKEHMDRHGARSIAMAWERDSKWPLVAENLGALAADLDVAIEFGRDWQADHPADLLVFKTLRGARTEGVAIFSAKGTRPKGVSNARQIIRKFGNAAHEPIVVQPYKEPDSLATAGVQFVGSEDDNDQATTYTDRKKIRGLEHIGIEPGAHVLSGMEHRFPMIFRSFVVYLPQEKRVRHIGGMWQATDGRIVHGGSHSVSGPLYVDGLLAHPDAKRSHSLDQAERLVRAYGHAGASASLR